MIEGFRLKFTSAELANHLRERASYHRKRATEKGSQLPKLKEAMDHIKSSAPATSVSQMGKGIGSYRSDDPVADLERDIRDHHNKALVFDLFASHLFDEDYNLEEDDLVRLEILKR